MLDFSVRLSTIGQVEEVFVQGWNPKNKEEFVARSGTGDERPMAGSASGPVTAQRAFGGTGGTRLTHRCKVNPRQIRWPVVGLEKMRCIMSMGHGVCIGRPDLKAGLLVEIEGLGRRFSGPYYVTSTEHSYKPNTGYRTAFTVRRNAT